MDEVGMRNDPARKFFDSRRKIKKRASRHERDRDGLPGRGQPRRIWFEVVLPLHREITATD